MFAKIVHGWFYVIIIFHNLFLCSLGPPDFYPQTPNCPEETLTKEYLQGGYREIVEGIEVYSLLYHAFCTEVGFSGRGIWTTAEDYSLPFIAFLIHF